MNDSNPHGLSVVNLWKLLLRVHYIADFSHKREAQHSSLALLAVYLRSLLALTLMWVVFTFGLKAKLPGGASYFAYFAPGFIAWTSFSDSIIAAYGYLKSNKFICENSKTRLGTILISNVYKSLQVQVLLLATLGAMHGLTAQAYSMWESAVLVIGFTYLAAISIALSAAVALLTIRFPRVDFYLPVLVSVVFWLTPIVWSSEVVPDRYQWIVQLNPFYQLSGLYRLGFGVEQGFHATFVTLTYLALSFLSAVLALRFINRHHLAVLDGLKK